MVASRSSWKGFLRLSLVSIPVKAFTAHDTGEDVRLNQLHKDCHNRIRYQKVCPEHGEVPADQIVSGYEYAKDQYVVIDPGELAKLRSESDKTVGIEGFVKTEQIDPLYFAGRTYYLLPDGVAGTKPYALLHRGMVEADVVGVAQVVLFGREQLVCLRAIGNLLAMTVLTYAEKIKPVSDFDDELKEQKMSNEERALASTLIDASVLEDFDLKRWSDPYNGRLTKVIEMKVEGKEVVEVPHADEPKIINLMDALKRSVAQAQAQATGSRASGAGAGGGGDSGDGGGSGGGRKGPKRLADASAEPATRVAPAKKMAPSASAKKAPARKKKSG